ncbi:AIR synthase related protein [Senegalia massiliensis]|uniref:Selenophosphate synthase n=1 Tax=Senegalia massiliensis TaxID=1720316 RepID=A0A845QZ88_9CLOT|nr:AIR synthase related protein [Senegalia massiliensis]NBI06482.1 selenophosphate synthase [Senegalia massiliensis]
MNSTQFRDLTFIDINENDKLIISCDSAGGIGNKEKDIVKTYPETLGYLTLHVVLSELFSIGAKPISIINTLSVEMNPTGNIILNGIKNLLRELNLDEDILVTGSTEENFPTVQTGIGLTAIGLVDKRNFKMPYTPKNSLIAVVGIPKVGNEILEDNGEIISIKNIIDLKQKDYIHEILPVGSQGILKEIEEMAKTNDLDYSIDESVDIDLYKSAGTSTCIIVSIDHKDYETLKNDIDKPVFKVGKFYDKS